MRMELDHLVISAQDLPKTAAEIDLPWLNGGHHADFGTYNRLLGLGPDIYLELIAIDPEAPSLDKTRWYNLDRFTGAPRFTHWVLRVDDLEAALDRFGAEFGEIHNLSRGDLRWRMAVPRSGVLPFDDCAPALIQWDTPPPAPRLTDQGHRLRNLVVQHPQASDLKSLFEGLNDPRVQFVDGVGGLSATLAHPDGDVILS